MERIRQWEFLSVRDEELIDTVRHGFFGDDQLIRIYYGTLRLGVDLAETKEGWLRLGGHCAEIIEFSLITKRQTVRHSVFLLPSHFTLDAAGTLEGTFDNFYAFIQLFKAVSLYEYLRIYHKELLVFYSNFVKYAYHCITLIFYSLRHL